jgi:hypothetical protein
MHYRVLLNSLTTTVLPEDLYCWTLMSNDVPAICNVLHLAQPALQVTSAHESSAGLSQANKAKNLIDVKTQSRCWGKRTM